MEKSIRVYLVGAGPGDPELITQKGLRLLQECDVVVYDRLAGEALLAKTKHGCEQICAGKQAGRHSMKQTAINRILVQKAKEGKMVVRLKGGDPFVFGRGGEEAEYLQEHGIVYELVPGVTSATAVPELAGIPITYRDLSRSFHVITGHTSAKDPEEVKEYLRRQIKGLQNVEGTFVFLMGFASLKTICELMIEYGRSKRLPAAVISKGCSCDEKVVRGNLMNISQKVRQEQIEAPAVIVIGECAGLDMRMKSGRKPDERPRKALLGCKIGITGTRRFAERLKEKLREQGADVLYMQELHVQDIQGSLPEDLQDYTWIVFTGSNGVHSFFRALKRQGLDIRILSGKRIALTGSGTAAALADYYLKYDYMPEVFDVEHLTDGLLQLLDKEKDKIFLYQARRGNPVLERRLREAGFHIRRWDGYDTFAGSLIFEKSLPDLSYLTFASSSGVDAFCRAKPDIFKSEVYRSVRAVAIGSKTAERLRQAGCWNLLTADRFDIEGMIEAMKKERRIKEI